MDLLSKKYVQAKEIAELKAENDGSKSSCKDFVLPTKQFYQQILANVITKITKVEEE